MVGVHVQRPQAVKTRNKFATLLHTKMEQNSKFESLTSGRTSMARSCLPVQQVHFDVTFMSECSVSLYHDLFMYCEKCGRRNTVEW